MDNNVSRKYVATTSDKVAIDNLRRECEESCKTLRIPYSEQNFCDYLKAIHIYMNVNNEALRLDGNIIEVLFEAFVERKVPERGLNSLRELEEDLKRDFDIQGDEDTVCLLWQAIILHVLKTKTPKIITGMEVYNIFERLLNAKA